MNPTSPAVAKSANSQANNSESGRGRTIEQFSFKNHTNWRVTFARRALLILLGLLIGVMLDGLILNGLASRSLTEFWSRYPQPVATILGASIAVSAAIVALENGNRTRALDRQITDELAGRTIEQERRSHEKDLRDRFHEIIKLLSDGVGMRAKATYSLAALADDWGTFHAEDIQQARSEQQVCINILVAQLHDKIEGLGLAERQAMITLKRAVQEVIRLRLVPDDIDRNGIGAWSSFQFNFAGCEFYELDFSDTAFVGEATFNDIIVHGRASFSNARFGGAVSFGEARFHGSAMFDDVRFLGEAGFGGVQFDGAALFDNASFARGVSFEGVHIDGRASFDKAHFHGAAQFRRAHLFGSISFQEARFDGVASFNKSHFAFGGIFRQAHFFSMAEFADVHFVGSAWFGQAHFYRNAGFNGAKFDRDAWFISAHFIGRVDFSLARFAVGAEFVSSHFHRGANLGLVGASMSYINVVLIRFDYAWIDGQISGLETPTTDYLVESYIEDPKKNRRESVEFSTSAANFVPEENFPPCVSCRSLRGDQP